MMLMCGPNNVSTLNGEGGGERRGVPLCVILIPLNARSYSSKTVWKLNSRCECSSAHAEMVPGLKRIYKSRVPSLIPNSGRNKKQWQKKSLSGGGYAF